MIEVQDISKTYKVGDIETQAVKNVCFKIEAGEFVAIMGPSGSGKSTLMHILGMLDVPTGGKYIFDRKDVSGFDDDKLAFIRSKKIGFVFQSFNLLPRATVFRNVMLPLIYSGVVPEEREEKTRKALVAVGMPEDRWHHYPNQISGGQMQRVAIARALVNDPSLILADEPTGNLDTKTGELVLETFRKFNREKGHSIILITHELYVAEHADRIIHILDGMIVEDKKNGNKRT